MGRVFIVSNRVFRENSGGGSGVSYRLYKANQEYSLMDNTFHLFRNTVLCSDASVLYTNPVIKKKNLSRPLVEKIEKSGLLSIVKHIIGLEYYYHRIHRINKKFDFNNDDTYIFMDVESAYCFCKRFKCNKSILVYHQQGSMYNEWKSVHGTSSELLKEYLFCFMKTTLNRVHDLGFPSKGARQTLIDCDLRFKQIIEKKKIEYFYNGVDNACEKIIRTKRIIQSESSKVHFITVSALNEAKAVETIPKYLSKIKRNHISINWTLIGSGIKSKDVEAQIEKNGIIDEVNWIKESIDHDRIMTLLCEADFYILLHKYSIFDYATLEAMSCGLIPVLSPVGGNLELNLDNNIIFVKGDKDIDRLINLIKHEDIIKLKEKNINLQKKEFCAKRFLERYSDWCKRILESI